MAAKFPSEQFAVLAVDDSNQKKKTVKMVEKTGVSFPVLIDDKSVGREIYKIRGTPTTYMINREGLIVFKHLGYAPEMDEMMEREVRSLLGGPA
ncbi:MAG: TlpA family protein disulfide reductase [Candidatus Eiseniibacteriota bacterium]|nr:MAG: TlpA family protein disulfide reductase [Candidatus Eisenbacteria bacterium]